MVDHQSSINIRQRVARQTAVRAFITYNSRVLLKKVGIGLRYIGQGLPSWPRQVQHIGCNAACALKGRFWCSVRRGILDSGAHLITQIIRVTAAVHNCLHEGPDNFGTATAVITHCVEECPL